MVEFFVTFDLQAARQRKRDAATTNEVTNQSQDSSVLDDVQIDDDDILDPVELAASGVKVHADEECDSVDTSRGLVGLHQAILMSIDKCGKT